MLQTVTQQQRAALRPTQGLSDSILKLEDVGSTRYISKKGRQNILLAPHVGDVVSQTYYVSMQEHKHLD